MATPRTPTFANKCIEFLKAAKPTPREFIAGWSLVFLKFCTAHKLDAVAELTKMQQAFPMHAPPSAPTKPPSAPN